MNKLQLFCFGEITVDMSHKLQKYSSRSIYKAKIEDLFWSYISQFIMNI